MPSWGKHHPREYTSHRERYAREASSRRDAHTEGRRTNKMNERKYNAPPEEKKYPSAAHTGFREQTKSYFTRAASKPKTFVKRKSTGKGFRRTSGYHAKTTGRSFWAAGPGHELKGTLPMIAHNQGTKVERVYGAFGGTISSTAAITSQLGYSFRIMNNAGNIDLEMWSGSPGGGGALIVTFNDFRAECAHFIDVFKWLSITAVEMQFYPIVNSVQESAVAVTDIATQNDPGRFFVAPWNGDPDSVSAAGVPQVDLTEFMRYKPLSMDPVGSKGITYTRKPNMFLVEAGDVFPTAGVPNRFSFPVARPWETAQFRVASAAMPVYGFQYMWQHNQASVNSAKWSIGYNVRVKVQWNTMWDADLAAAQMLEKAAYLANLPMPQNVAPIGRDSYKMLPLVVDEKKHQQDPAYEIVRAPPPSPLLIKPAGPAPQAVKSYFGR